MEKKKVVIALGGNALGKDIEEQKEAVAKTAKVIVDLAQQGLDIIITHGNGPQVGMIQKAMDMVSVCCRVMAGHRQRHDSSALLRLYFSCLDAREIVRLVLIAVDGKVFKLHPRQAGHRIGIGRRRLRLCQNSVMPAEPLLVFHISLMKLRKCIAVLRPHQREGVVIRMNRRIERRQDIKVSQLSVLNRTLKLHLFIQILCDKPEIRRKKLESRVLHGMVQLCHIQ